ncbi:hypothetical protein Scep_004483 [Stephania cephalantha]|uniref:Uncharacterized protein n=1 Tax=Stephania cephalantha TaxID=152367 RepID=A0AAP0KU67_9MAGN
MTDEEELCSTQPIFNLAEDVSVDTLKKFEVNEVTQMEDNLRETAEGREVFQIEPEIVIALDEGENEMKIDIFYTADTFVLDDPDATYSFVLEVPNELLNLKEGVRRSARLNSWPENTQNGVFTRSGWTPDNLPRVTCCAVGRKGDSRPSRPPHVTLPLDNHVTVSIFSSNQEPPHQCLQHVTNQQQLTRFNLHQFFLGMHVSTISQIFTTASLPATCCALNHSGLHSNSSPPIRRCHVSARQQTNQSSMDT